ncbi:MAG: HD domain-containing protein [Desulfovibrionaceae bacterium]
MTPAVAAQLAAHKERFALFVDRFLCGDPAADALFELKRKHTGQVYANAVRIAASLGLAGDTERDVLLAALYHDVGRFPQYALYKTFLDRASENHALMGVKALRREGMLDDLSLASRAVVRGAVALHNRYQVAEAVPGPVRLATDVVRDADKVDIMRVMLAHFDADAAPDDVVVLHVRDEPGQWTRAVYEDVMAGRLARYGDMAYVNDFILLICGWVNDLNFAESMRIVRERGLLHDLLTCLPDCTAMRVLGARLLGALQRRIAAAR